ncbi:MAG TPA: 2-succinyl-5-enolpyruvyl-6-hydroxy-3-cyclohexene-1-carboxylic-acid synthase [Phototrophicaceae bacterium]|jgi:2-succinyl-5-enolpyruvyl-6-hydroxy-3-cyclohexene-1-carboxylate synthase|nr:2-succinyl-5-enolpyruvyl-6-hydroxy-3-cyclohexene-1-carboxylic-acid synthase [Phototrophicaceae bacterium]
MSESSMSAAPNRNIFWAKTFVDELARCGLEAVCIAPGSRSTPLVIAFAENPHIKVYSHIDERSAAFFALGMAQATDKPIAILCSSGTATANFHPAIIEARYANVPLIVLTADRQHELRDSGANQTVDQVKMFGDHVLWFYDVALPEANPPGVAIRNLRTLADRAYAKANSIEKGPVHLNFPFRKPLEPIPVADDVTDIEPHLSNDERPTTVISAGELILSNFEVESLLKVIRASQRGVIICGPRTSKDARLAISNLALKTGFPIFADITSNMRFLHYLGKITVIGGYDNFLPIADHLFDPPDLIIHFGAMPASSALEAYLNNIEPSHRILISNTGVWTDPYHRIDMLVQADIATLCHKLSYKLEKSVVDEAWLTKLRQVEQVTWGVLDNELNHELFDGSAIAATFDQFGYTITSASNEKEIIQAQKDGDSHLQCFLASSLSVRHAEQFVSPFHWIPEIYSNRGASGIDGTISSAFGVAAAHPASQVMLITGDLAFYHDMNGLLAAKRCHINNITIVLINNDGGGIFNRLPIAQFDPPFTDLFLTPHGLDFEPAIRMYGFAYHRAESLDDLRQAVNKSVKADAQTPTVIEVRTDSKRDHERRLEINQRVQEHLRTLSVSL